MKGWTVATWVLMAALLTAGAWASEAKAPSGEPIKIGAMFAVTGPAAWLGEPEKNTALMIAEEINAKGGVMGRPLEVIIEDTEGDDTKAVLAAKKLITQGVIAIIGPSRSGTTMAVVPIVQEEEIPLISCAAAAVIVKPVEERKWVFKTPQMDSDCVIRIYEHMKGLADKIKDEVHNFAEANSIDLRLIGLESWFIPHFVPSDPKTPRDLRDIADMIKQEILCQYMRYHGVYLPDLHTVFMSAVHSEEDADKIIDAFKKSLIEMREDGHL